MSTETRPSDVWACVHGGEDETCGRRPAPRSTNHKEVA